MNDEWEGRLKKDFEEGAHYLPGLFKV